MIPSDSDPTHMRMILPYRFATSYIGTLVFKAAACLEAVLLLGLLMKLFTGELSDAAGIVIVLMVVGGFALGGTPEENGFHPRGSCRSVLQSLAGGASR